MRRGREGAAGRSILRCCARALMSARTLIPRFGTSWHRCNAARGSAFTWVTARKTARQNQERPDGEPDPERVPVREDVLWMRDGQGGPLRVRRTLRVQQRLPLHWRLRM